MDGLRSIQLINSIKRKIFFFFFLFSFSLFLSGEEPSFDNDSDNTGSMANDQDLVLDTDALRRQITDEAPGELVNLSINDSSVSLRLSGRWKGTLEGSLGFALTPFGTRALAGDNPIFSQEGDITLSLWLRDRWFVEASFMDNSALNTYRAGYEGEEGEIVRYAGVGNTGLDFPSFPYLDLGGDSPSSFGAYGHFAAGDLSFYSLLRYDAAAREERVFVGDRERSYSYADLSRPQRGISFVLPDENLPVMPEVYIQDNKGNLAGSDGRQWRLAESSEYGASLYQGIIELTLGTYTGGSAEPESKIAVYYGLPYSLGTYDDAPDPADPNKPFLASVQNYFDSTKTILRLWDYPQPGQMSQAVQGTPANVPGTVTVNGVTALVIYEPGTFSPFERQNRYKAPVSTSSEAALVKPSTGETIGNFELIPFDNSTFDTMIQNPEQRQIMRGQYELINEGSPGSPLTRNLRSPTERWPLGASYPALYLPGKTVFTEDISLRFTNYSSSGAFIIGTDVVPGSVQVFRNGIQDPNFSYNQSIGSVNLFNPALFSEIIRISYLRQSSERRHGSLAAGIGAIWDPETHFSGKLGLGLRWNVTSDTYSENDASSPGTVGLGAEARWDYDRLKAGITLGLGFEQPDTTGLYRAAGMEENEIILSLPPGSSFISETPPFYDPHERAPLLYRNYRTNSLLGGSSLDDISGSAPVVSDQSGPYPVNDRILASQVLAAEFEFTQNKTWTGFEVPLGLRSDFLEQAGIIEVPFRFLDFSRDILPGDNFTIVFQIGALADKDSSFQENPNLILEKTLYVFPSPPSPPDFDSGARIAVFNLNDEDRSKLQNAKYFRLLVTADGITSNLTGNLSGRVILAPPIVRGSFWRPVTVKDTDIFSTLSAGFMGPEVNVTEEADPSLLIKYQELMDELHSISSRQRVLQISWNGFSLSDQGPGADGRLAAIPLSKYRSLSFFIRRPEALREMTDTDTSYRDKQDKLDEAKLRFIIASGPESLKNQSEIALDAEIPLRDFDTVEPGEWTRVDIEYRAGNPGIFIDGKKSTGPEPKYNSAAMSDYLSGNYSPGTADEWKSSYAAFYLIPGSNALPGGNMAIDEIILEDVIPSYRLNGGASLEWTKQGTLLKIRNLDVISDVSFLAAVESGAQGNPFEEGGADGGFGMNGRTQAGFSFFGIKILGNFSYSLSNYQSNGLGYSWSAGHSLSRSFGPFTVRESFDDAPDAGTMNHRLSFNLDTALRALLEGEVIRENDRLRRRWQAGTGGTPIKKIPVDFSLDAQMGITEKTGRRNGNLNYAEDWADSFIDMLPASGAGSEGRNLNLSNRIRLNTAPLGTELFFQGTSSYLRTLNTIESGSLLRLDFPINPEGDKLRMLFRAEREYYRDASWSSRDFGEDMEIWAGSFGSAGLLMFSIPFYSLFDAKLEDRMKNFGAPGGNEYVVPDLSLFADRYEFSLLTAMNYGLSSLLLPRRFALNLGRVLERKYETPRDTLGFGTVLGFSSVNLFGAMGTFPVFGFYQGDEF